MSRVSCLVYVVMSLFCLCVRVSVVRFCYSSLLVLCCVYLFAWCVDVLVAVSVVLDMICLMVLMLHSMLLCFLLYSDAARIMVVHYLLLYFRNQSTHPHT